MSDVTELFHRDPLKMTNCDIDIIIAEMRKKRVMFNAAPLAAKKAAPKLTAGQEAATKLSLDIKL